MIRGRCFPVHQDTWSLGNVAQIYLLEPRRDYRCFLSFKSMNELHRWPRRSFGQIVHDLLGGIVVLDFDYYELLRKTQLHFLASRCWLHVMDIQDRLGSTIVSISREGSNGSSVMRAKERSISRSVANHLSSSKWKCLNTREEKISNRFTNKCCRV